MEVGDLVKMDQVMFGTSYPRYIKNPERTLAMEIVDKETGKKLSIFTQKGIVTDRQKRCIRSFVKDGKK